MKEFKIEYSMYRKSENLQEIPPMKKYSNTHFYRKIPLNLTSDPLTQKVAAPEWVLHFIH